MPLWVPLATAILRQCCPSSHPAMAMMSAAMASDIEAEAGFLPSSGSIFPIALPRGPLTRWVAGLRALGSIAQVLPAPAPASWCASAPIWSNPVLQLELPPHRRTVQWPAAPAHPGFAGLRCTMLSASTVGDVIRLHDSLQATPQHATLPAPAARLALNVLGTILAVLPAGWLGAARSALMVGTAPDQNMAVRHLLGSLGWAIPQQGALTHPRIVAIGGISMTTSSTTFIQLQPQREAQCQRQHSFICAAVSASPQGQLRGRAHSVATLSAIMRTLWVTRWDNRVKETLWRLSVNGIAGAGGHDLPLGQPCPCGWTPTQGSPPASSSSAASSHCFWHCPAAQAVVAEIKRALPGSVALSCADVWLLSPPSA